MPRLAQQSTMARRARWELALPRWLASFVVVVVVVVGVVGTDGERARLKRSKISSDKKNRTPLLPAAACTILMRPAENHIPRPIYPLPQPLLISPQHQLKQLSRALRELVDLSAGRRMEDSEAGVDVPLVGIDSEHYVYFDGFDAADVVAVFPGVT